MRTRDIFADAARRHAHALPGHILLAAEPSAIPASILTVDVLAEQAEDLEASSKYALRAMLNGIDTVEDLELFLGLDEGDTANVVAALLVAEFIDYRPPPEGGARRLSLLTAGQEAARDACIRRPKSTTVQVIYDRLTNTVTDWRKHSLLRAAQAKSDPARILMPPSTSMPVQLENLDNAAISTALGSRNDTFRILGVSGVTENRNYYRDAILLVFKDIDSNALRLGVEIDGQWSEPHAAALDAIGAVERLGLSTAPNEETYEPVDEPGKRLSREEVIAVQAAMAQQDDAHDADTLSRSAIRWLGVYEHPMYLDEALSNSQRRLLIISPWITRSVVTAQWVSRLEQLARTADVTIFWGFGDNEKTDQTAIADLYTAAQRSSRLAVVRVDDTHAKILVGDDFYIKTSFNWLSFRGDRSRKYRQEEGDLVQDQVLADGAYKKYMTENLSHALDVIGTLPAEYQGLVGADVTTQPSTRPPAPDAPGPEDKTPTKTRNVGKSPKRHYGNEERKKEALSKLAVGQTLSGPITNITEFGAFVNLGDVDGLIHKTRLGRGRIEHPSEVVSVGEIVTVMVVDVDIDRGRIALALKTI
ncbi:MAG: S1 RNA-binding domain-containing protein [Fimbriimonadaceae bacterium]|nr:S1 RNA-binding domain-containing protein [Fimbriimonadaceae bacterium]